VGERNGVHIKKGCLCKRRGDTNREKNVCKGKWMSVQTMAEMQ